MAKKILVVDDEKHFRRMLQNNFEGAGYEVVTASDGIEALEKVISEKPDLITLDDQMQSMDGFEVLKRLKKNPDTRDIPVMMIASKSQDEDVFRARQAGVEWYVCKSFNTFNTLAVLSSAISIFADK